MTDGDDQLYTLAYRSVPDETRTWKSCIAAKSADEMLEQTVFAIKILSIILRQLFKTSLSQSA